ncbi:hypothetical protein EVAR_5473_1 [Eumeta japonica]|uniref:Uncharacterized protein n=1 Tax=Eumeta variegata TaxID=151549 RepID=A0A4C1T9T4_EUMVA|nr:hypothetical protein EVAR_5473_1 [Eumeta japonica]
MMSGGKKRKVDAEGRRFQQKRIEESFFILCNALGESSNLSDKAQLAIFIRDVEQESTGTEESLALQPLKGILQERTFLMKFKR